MENGGVDILALKQMFEDCSHKEEEEHQEYFEQVIEEKEKETFWDDDEITPVGFYKDLSDDRPEPKYHIHYKQCIGTGDVYLGLNMNDPSNANIDAVVIKVALNGTQPDDIDLNVMNGFLDLRCPKYHLTLKLDKVPDDKKEVSAKWKQETEELTIEVPVKREEIKIV